MKQVNWGTSYGALILMPFLKSAPFLPLLSNVFTCDHHFIFASASSFALRPTLVMLLISLLFLTLLSDHNFAFPCLYLGKLWRLGDSMTSRWFHWSCGLCDTSLQVCALVEALRTSPQHPTVRISHFTISTLWNLSNSSLSEYKPAVTNLHLLTIPGLIA